MELLLDPSVWVGLFALIVLEIVLGIDNLVFIAILVDKLPPEQRDKARVTGLTLALVMRLGLLSIMSWLITLTQPLISLGDYSYSGRDIILTVGGFFLLLKGTLELHDRVEGKSLTASGGQAFASMGVIITQIVVLDAVFSLDAVITAVGMVEHLPVMMAAVIIAIGVMIIASKPLTTFINERPTVVILCLGFLLMIGFSLIAEGLGFAVPKGYLYAAIGFSILIESLNQVARHRYQKIEARMPLRARTAKAVLRMLSRQNDSLGIEVEQSPEEITFDTKEHDMVSGVLTLADRSIHSIITPRNEVSWINIQEDPQILQEYIISTPHSFFPVCNGNLDDVIGIGRAKELIADLIEHGKIEYNRLREPLIVHESIGIIDLIDTLRMSRGQQVLVTDEFGVIQGLVTPIDVFEAIAGEFPDEDEAPDIIQLSENRWRMDGGADLHHIELLLNTEQMVNEDKYTTLAGYLLHRFDHLPNAKDSCLIEEADFTIKFTILKVSARKIISVLVERY